MAQMEPSLSSYHDATHYPHNVADSTLAPYVVDAISDRLNKHAPILFADETEAALNFLDLGNSAEGMWHSVFLSRTGLTRQEYARFLAESYQEC